MKDWFSRLIEHEVAHFGREPDKVYFIEEREHSELGHTRWDVHTVEIGELDTLSREWEFVDQDVRSFLPKLKRKGISENVLPTV
jgi:hypothetical protein